MLLMILTEKKLLEHLQQRIAKNIKKKKKIKIKKNNKTEKAIKKKCSKSHVKWKGYNNLFNSWIHKKHMI